MDMNVQAEALRRKNAGDPRSIAEIVAELSVAPAAPQAAAVNPTPASPVPVGQPVEIAPQPAAVPPMAKQ